jgi:hypothetical protein
MRRITVDEELQMDAKSTMQSAGVGESAARPNTVIPVQCQLIKGDRRLRPENRSYERARITARKANCFSKERGAQTFPSSCLIREYYWTIPCSLRALFLKSNG